MQKFYDYEGNAVRVGDLFRHFMDEHDGMVSGVMRLDRYRDQRETPGVKPGDAEFTIVRYGGKMDGRKAYSNVNAMVLLTPRHKRSRHRYRG